MTWPRWKRGTLEERFWGQVVKTETCWLWDGAPVRDGYGRIGVNGKSRAAHRVSYEMHVGPIPAGLVIDHLCRVHNCVNPDHLEPVTTRENLLRGLTSNAFKAAQTECIHGHPFDSENTKIRPNGTRECRQCHRDRDRARDRSGRVRNRRKRAAL